MLMKSKTECYSTAEMVRMITGQPCETPEDIPKVAPYLRAKGIVVKRDVVGWDVIALDEDCEKYLNEHPELIKG